MAVILVIDDEKDMLDNIVMFLHYEGYDVLRAENGEIGLQKARKHKPDIILCDINMPEMNGFEVLEEIRNDSTMQDIPFILLAIRNDTRDIDRGFDMGAQDYIIKPYNSRELATSIRKQYDLRMNEAKNKELKEQEEWDEISKKLKDLASQIGMIPT